MVATNPTQKIPLGGNNKNDVSTYIARLDEASITPGVPFVHNLGFSYSGGTFTVAGADGTALSASSVTDGNPAIVGFIDKSNLGQLKWATMSSNATFIDDTGSSNIVGNLFGTKASTAVSDDTTFYLYAVAKDDYSDFVVGISRIPNLTQSPASANIGTTSSADADSLGSMMILGAPTVTDYDNNPVVPLGSFRMQKSASDDWTVQALDQTKDGMSIRSIKNNQEWEHLMTVEASSSSSIEFLLDDQYTRYKAVLVNILPATDNVELHWRVSSDGGSTYDSGATNYQRAGLQATEDEGLVNYSDATIDEMRIGDGIGNAANSEGGYGEFKFYDFNNATEKPCVIGNYCYYESGGELETTYTTHKRNTAGDYNAIQLAFSSGNIASGKVIFYGQRDV